MADFPSPHGCDVVANGAGGAAAGARPQAFPPTQLEVRTPMAPTLFPSAGRDYLLYELCLSNFSDEAMTVRGVEILNADDDRMRVVSTLTEAQVKERLRMAGGGAQGEPARLGAGQGAIVSLCLAFDKTTAPAKSSAGSPG